MDLTSSDELWSDAWIPTFADNGHNLDITYTANIICTSLGPTPHPTCQGPCVRSLNRGRDPSKCAHTTPPIWAASVHLLIVSYCRSSLTMYRGRLLRGSVMSALGGVPTASEATNLVIVADNGQDPDITYTANGHNMYIPRSDLLVDM